MNKQIWLWLALLGAWPQASVAQSYRQNLVLDTAFGSNPLRVSNAFIRYEPFGPPQIRYWQPAVANTWGEVVYRFDLPFAARTAELFAPASVYTLGGPANFDPDAEAHVEVSLDDVQWRTIYSGVPGNVPPSLPIDLTGWIDDATSLYVRARLRTSTDYGDFSTSQFIRTAPGDGGYLKITGADSPSVANLAAAVSPPGSSPGYDGPVLRYGLTDSGDVVDLPDLYGAPTSSMHDPMGLAFDRHGELFVGNRFGNQPGAGSISRFRYSAEGIRVEGAPIMGNGLEAVHGLAFSPNGELFAANYLAGSISRFTFDDRGEAIPHGQITGLTPGQTIGVAFSPAGELFVSEYTQVRRFMIDPLTGEALSNGAFQVPGEQKLHFLEFDRYGRLFIAGLDSNTVYQYSFLTSGAPSLLNSFAVPEPIGLAFTADGELLVSSHGSGGIHRFTFDVGRHALPAGHIETGTPLGDLAFNVVPEPATWVLAVSGVAGLAALRRWRRCH
ncbi:MAG: hypothetical protein K1X74_17385 [Pirellulales bacterium]|nr:hypothetical protein [Pirellulales bacterium]